MKRMVLFYKSIDLEAYSQQTAVKRLL